MALTFDVGDIRRLKVCLERSIAFSSNGDVVSVSNSNIALQAETLARIAGDNALAAADSALEAQIVALQAPAFAHHLLLGGM